MNEIHAGNEFIKSLLEFKKELSLVTFYADST